MCSLPLTFTPARKLHLTGSYRRTKNTIGVPMHGKLNVFITAHNSQQPCGQSHRTVIPLRAAPVWMDTPAG